MTGNSSKPSALVIYHFFHPDDVISARHFSQFAEELSRRGWRVTALTSNRYCRYPGRKIFPRWENWNGVSILRTNRPPFNQARNIQRILNSIWLQCGWALDLLKLPKVDVAIVGTDPQFSALLLPFLRLFRRSRIVCHWCYDLYPEAIIADGASVITRWLALRVRHLVKLAYASADIIVDIGPCMKKRLSAYNHNAESATLVPWALVEPKGTKEPDPTLRRELFGDAELALLYSGNLGKAHDFSLFLKLARLLSGKSPKIAFCFACRGKRAHELKKAIQDTDKNIKIAPFVKEEELEKRLLAADIHLLSLRPEWAGIVVPSKFFGSLAVGRPVLYSGPKDSAIGEWIDKYDLGMILSEENIESVAGELLELAANREKLTRWQQNALETYRENFSKKQVMDRWDFILRSALNLLSSEDKGIKSAGHA